MQANSTLSVSVTRFKDSVWQTAVVKGVNACYLSFIYVHC